MVSNNRDIIEFVGTSPFLIFALQVAMATMHFLKAQTCVSFKNIFSYLGVSRSYFAPVRNSHKGERKAKLDNIRRIGHLLTTFRKISLFSVALNMDPKSALNLKIKNCMGLILSREGLN